jgi:hypothetical protein
VIKLGPKMISGVRSVSGGGVGFLHPKSVASAYVHAREHGWELRFTTHAGAMFVSSGYYSTPPDAYQALDRVETFITEALEKCDKQCLPGAKPVQFVTPWGWKIQARGTYLRVTRPDGTVSEWPDAPTTNGSGMYAMCQDILKHHGVVPA